MSECNLSVKGMMCANCEKRVTNALCQLDGVQSCTANASNGSVQISYDEEKVSKKMLAETIDEIGYIVDGEI